MSSMMALKRKCFVILLSLSFFGRGQSWIFVSSHEIPQTITTVDVGLLDKVYLGTDRGNIYSFLADGTPDTEFSSAIFQPVTSIDASNTLRPFVFYKDINTFEYLERFSAQPRAYSLADFGISRADFARIGLNNSIWLINGNELIQLNPLNRAILQRINLIGSINDIKALFITDNILIADADGIKNFSMNGTLINEVSVTGINNLFIDGSYAVAVSNDGLLTWNKLTTLSSLIKLPGNFSMGVRAGIYYHFVKGSTLFTYQLRE